jgi:hypothetical protein
VDVQRHYLAEPELVRRNLLHSTVAGQIFRFFTVHTITMDPRLKYVI